jgi:outer membrane protein OmpA-like peptidoglycan-associated protein
MKKLILLLMIGHSALSTLAQNTEVKNYVTDSEMSRWVLDVNLLGGIYDQQMDMAVTTPNYFNGININPGTIGFKKGGAVGGDIQLGVFFGKGKHFGLGAGLLYLRQWGSVTLDNFHAEYQSVDNNGFTFRQVVSSNNFHERIQTDNFNIPLVLKFKSRFSKRWGITADAGVLFNLQMKNRYSTNASFDYEAIYMFVTNDNGTVTPVYDNGVIPNNTDFLITKNHYSKNNPSGNVENYFNEKRAAGYNVGLGVQPDRQKGATTYTASTVGFIFQPSVNYFLSDRVALNFGGFFMYQPFKNDASGTYTMTGNPGEYNSITNAATDIQTQSYGGNLGLRFFLGKNENRMNITGANPYDPTICGLCNGSIALHGLQPGANAVVNYNVKGTDGPAAYAAVVNQDGTVVVPNLCAGSYTDIKATIGKKSASTGSVKLAEPKLVIGDVETVNPSAAGECDGEINIYGLTAGQKANLTYTVNGAASTVTGTVSSDNALRVTGLCDGNYSKMSVSSNNCVAEIFNPRTVLLRAPAKPKPVEYVENDTLTHVLFAFDESTILPVSYRLIDEAYAQLKADNNTYLVIDGNTDIVGSSEYNQKLSERRANAVKEYLVNKGISSSRIEVRGSGYRDPVATNSTDSGRSKNRRAEMILKIR